MTALASQSDTGPALVRTAAVRWPWLALAASAGLLAIAHAFETFGHLAPCELCLKQREAYWASLAVAAVGVALGFTRLPVRRAICALLAVVFLYGAGLAIYHAGAEWKFWPGPASCSSGSGGHISAADISRLLNGGPLKPPVCDRPAWVFLGLSMAGWNALIALTLAGGSITAARTRS